MAFFCYLVVLCMPLLIFAGLSEEASAYENCATQRLALLHALFKTGDNLNRLDEAFYPPKDGLTRYIRVNYDFLNSNGSNDGNCSVSYRWAVGAFLFIQPPELFTYTSLFFSIPSNNVESVTLTLPYECRELVHYNEECSCSKSPVLRKLTLQVKCLLANLCMLCHTHCAYTMHMHQLQAAQVYTHW